MARHTKRLIVFEDGIEIYLMFNVWGAHRDADRCILVTAAQERL
jgi:hypothetical protein